MLLSINVILNIFLCIIILSHRCRHFTQKPQRTKYKKSKNCFLNKKFYSVFLLYFLSKCKYDIGKCVFPFVLLFIYLFIIRKTSFFYIYFLRIFCDTRWSFLFSIFLVFLKQFSILVSQAFPCYTILDIIYLFFFFC